MNTPFVLGTAGHIDHGKTSLVACLTGIDCDRLEEEKKRGITIELGFAPLVLNEGKTISIVDVPGHERFIRQMVAGASGIDGVILVIAADEGVMPQTREHLDILRLLGVSKGIVAITKKDIVDDDFLELVTEDIKDFVKGTFLEGAPLCPVSSVTGEGKEELLKQIEILTSFGSARDKDGAFFMPIDRAFGIKGFGTVVTGTVYRGALQEGEDAEILPFSHIAGAGSHVVRSIQVHSRGVKLAQAQDRAAINIAGISLEDVKRGDVICAPHAYKPTQNLEVRLSLLENTPYQLKHNQRVRLHVGTSDVLARVAMLDRTRLEKGGAAFVQLLAEEPIAATSGQGFVIRLYSPLFTIGGGTVIYPYGQRQRGREARAARLKFLEGLSAASSAKDERERIKNKIAAYLDFYGTAQISDIELDLRIEKKATNAAIASMASKKNIIYISNYLISLKKSQQTEHKLIDLLEIFHKNNPESKGISADECHSVFTEIDIKAFRQWLSLLGQNEEKKQIILEDARLRLASFIPSDGSFEDIAVKLSELSEQRGYEFLSLDEIGAIFSLDAPMLRRLINLMIQRGHGRIIGENFYLPKVIFEKFWRLLPEIDGDITVGTIRDLCATSRKYALPLLEFFDSQGITKRAENKRILRCHPLSGQNSLKT